MLLACISTLPLLAVGNNEQVGKALESALRQRVSTCEEIAVSCALHLRRQDQTAVESQIKQFAERSPDLASVRLVRFDGLVIQSIGDHATNWIIGPDDMSTPTNIRVPLIRNNRNWGSLEVAFKAEEFAQSSFANWKSLLTVFALNLTSFGMLLRRSLPAMNTSNAVPRRVRNTLDTLAVAWSFWMARSALFWRTKHSRRAVESKQTNWLDVLWTNSKWRFLEDVSPWETAIQNGQRCSGGTVFLLDGEGNERCFVVNATPVFDANEKLAGTLVSFEDVTTLELQKQNLMNAVSEIERSRALIHEQNLRFKSWLPRTH